MAIRDTTRAEIISTFVGKTVKAVDDSCENMIVFHFTDGTSAKLFADCGSGNTSIPFFTLEK